MKQARKELWIFLVVTYGLTFLMAIPMAIFSQQGKDLIPFPHAQMLYPAAGLMLAKLICRRDDPTLPKPFFLGFLALTAIAVANCFLPDLLSYVLTPGGLALGVLLLSTKEELLRPHHLTGGSWGQSLRILVLFLVLFLGYAFLCSATSAGLAETIQGFLSPALPRLLVMLPLYFVLSFPYFLGEEYGWRTYFQPLLQEKFGLIKGVVVFGILWEFWHLPLVIFYYSPQDPTMNLAQVILSRYVNVMCLAVFMAYAYMKTQNVWLPAFLHCANNNLTALDLGAGGGGELTWGMLGLFLLIRMALYLPLLRSRVFRPQPGS